MTPLETLALAIESSLRLHEKVTRNIKGPFGSGQRGGVDDLAEEIRRVMAGQGIDADKMRELIVKDSEFWDEQAEGIVAPQTIRLTYYDSIPDNLTCAECNAKIDAEGLHLGSPSRHVRMEDTPWACDCGSEEFRRS